MKLTLHPNVEDRLASIAAKPAGSYLFYGPHKVGRRQAAVVLAKRLNCDGGGSDNCSICTQIESGNFPGLVLLEPAADAKTAKIGISHVQRLQEELSLGSYYVSKSRLVVVDLADNLTPEAQNCFLKTLEEPPLDTTIVLLSEDPDLLLPTVRSRVQAVYFPLTEKPVHDPRIKELVRKTLLGDTFQRLMLVPEILAAHEFLGALESAVGSGLRRGKLQPTTGARWLAAIERAERYMAANVNPKAALEGLMLELEFSHA